jgi:hypothetical protein
MANLTRKNQKIFAQNATNNGQFGSLQDGSGIPSNDLDVLQANPAYKEGWNGATISGEELPALEELQGLNYVNTSQIAYIMQKGIPEWEVATDYYIGDIAREVGGTKLYKSLTDNNVGNVLTDVVKWEFLIDLAASGVEAASQEEVDSGVVSDKFVAPSTLLGLFGASSQATNGYVRMPVNIGGAFDEIIIQWGTNTAATAGGSTYNFPIAFPTNAFSIVSSLANQLTPPAAQTRIISASQFNLEVSAGTPICNWIAIGF